ncbi:MAG: 50S ribosomal protein L21 [Candidatus Levyibacteriota bacterium]|nr:MAG: 50S ribosomal protein L21 [Candidatus Levybacteria bacterium]
MNYVIVEAGGKQYKASVGDVLEIDRLSVEKDKEISFDKVLFLRTDGQVQIGKPTLSDVRVRGKVLDHIKGEKIRVSKYKAKVRHRRTTGFRAALTKVQIVGIDFLGSTKTEEKKKIKGDVLIS